MCALTTLQIPVILCCSLAHTFLTLTAKDHTSTIEKELPTITKMLIVRGVFSGGLEHPLSSDRTTNTVNEIRCYKLTPSNSRDFEGLALVSDFFY